MHDRQYRQNILLQRQSIKKRFLVPLVVPALDIKRIPPRVYGHAVHPSIPAREVAASSELLAMGELLTTLLEEDLMPREANELRDALKSYSQNINA